MTSAHVMPNGQRWDVKGNGAIIPPQHNTQEAAINAARTWLQNNGGGELNIHGTDGAIRAKDTIFPGNDPRNRRG
jgi:hypothetical protein